MVIILFGCYFCSAIKVAMESTNEKIGNLVVLGTPAEEGGGGKIRMIKSGCFKDLDLCMMVHPYPSDNMYPQFLARLLVTVRYKGHAAHAAAFPWEGINALDAAIIAYNSISMLRQQMKPSWRVHGIITDGGARPNIIPESSEMQFYLRAPTDEDLGILKAKIQKCFEGASLATGKYRSFHIIKFNYITSVNKCRARIILTAIILHEGPRIISESFGFSAYQLISQVFT